MKNEDAFLWQDTRGDFHLLMHGMEPYGPFGRHGYSHTGAAGTWTFSPTKAYDNRIEFQDGSVSTPARRERPHMLLSASGEPTHLYTSVQDKWPTASALNDHSYTHVQEIRTATGPTPAPAPTPPLPPPTPPPPTPPAPPAAPTPTPATKTCPSCQGGACGCSWIKPGTCDGPGDGSCCFKCCCDRSIALVY